MNLKLVAVPLLILIIIIFSVWMVHPAYLEMKESSQKLSAEEKSLAVFEGRAAAAENLYAELEANDLMRETLSEYIPSEKKDEDIINNLNDISFVNGLSVLEISFQEEKRSAGPATDTFGMPLPVDPTTGEPAEIDPMTGEILISTAPKPKIVDVRTVVIGQYEQIKTVLRKIGTLKRYNKIKSLKISKDVALSPGNEADSNLLKAEATISFNYLKGVQEISGLDNEILGKENFDFSAAERIREEKNVAAPAINIISAGRGNPFVLSGN